MPKLSELINIGATNKPADIEMLMELERQRLNISIDEESVHGKNESDINYKRLKTDFLNYTGRELDREGLFTLKLLSMEHDQILPTMGGLLLAGTDADLFEFAKIKCARFKGNDMVEFIDQKEFTGPLYSQIENVINFAKIYIPKAGKIVGIQRVDRFAIPLEAVREAIVNAVVHRDYSISGSDIKFAVFDNRIEITSPGTLPRSLEIDDIIAGRSEIRNRVIARFFREINFIEQWGTGIQKILSLCRENGQKKPEFKESGLFFKVVLFMAKKRDKLTETSQKTSQKTSQETSQKTSQKIFSLLHQNNRLTIKELADSLSISDRAVKNNLKILKESEKLIRVGPDKGGFWQVKE
ncbi:MAG: ATP-binding protein [Thermodesulfobacteriota bacterium]|nr:ATP-binding protein [Thermodesulfobacteriota bacterium]